MCRRDRCIGTLSPPPVAGETDGIVSTTGASFAARGIKGLTDCWWLRELRRRVPSKRVFAEAKGLAM